MPPVHLSLVLCLYVKTCNTSNLVCLHLWQHCVWLSVWQPLCVSEWIMYVRFHPPVFNEHIAKKGFNAWLRGKSCCFDKSKIQQSAKETHLVNSWWHTLSMWLPHPLNLPLFWRVKNSLNAPHKSDVTLLTLIHEINKNDMVLPKMTIAVSMFCLYKSNAPTTVYLV